MDSRKHLALLALSALAVAVSAEGSDTVWASVVFARGGERAPDTNLLYGSQLTPTGALQMQDLGEFLRKSYLSDQPMPGISDTFINPSQVYTLATGDVQFGPASAQALMQGLYPPTSDSGSGETSPLAVTPTGIVQAPLGDYQYPYVQAPTQYDQEFTYLHGDQNCPMFLNYWNRYTSNIMNENLQEQNYDLYLEVGTTLGDAQFSPEAYGYWNAFEVYQYVDYLYHHNESARSLLKSGNLAKLDAYNRLRYLADSYQWNLYGNLQNYEDQDPISTIAGHSLVALILSLLEINIGSSGQLNKLNILVGDYAPLISFFSLANLQDVSADFTGMPKYGSAAIFELIAPSDTRLESDSEGHRFPNVNDLRVRFSFRNGTGSEATLVSAHLFSTDTSSISWNAFETDMNSLTIGTFEQWCGACDAWSLVPFCLFYNATARDAAFGLSTPSDFGMIPGVAPNLTPALAGVIGATVTIGALGLILVAAIMFGGLRFTFAKRAQREGGGGGGGFRGSQKMASDADLTVVKGGVGVNVDDHGTKERVGSWELKNQAEANRALGIDSSIQAPAPTGTRLHRTSSVVSSIKSFRTQDPDQNPFQDPVVPREHV